MATDIAGLHWQADPETLEFQRAVVVVALRGWFDAAGTATRAAEWLVEHGEPIGLAALDAEEFMDMRAHRPEARLTASGDRWVSWPHVTVKAIRTGGTHDLLVVQGAEPDYRWRTFTEALIEIARAARAELVVTLGASPAEVPHTRHQTLATSASSAELARRLGLALPSYQGVTGVIGVLQERLGREGLPGISIRAGIPPYLGNGPNPGGTKALLARLGELLHIDTRADELGPEITGWIAGLQATMDADPQARATVEHFERRYDRANEATSDPGRLVRDLERYLRDAGDEPPLD